MQICFAISLLVMQLLEIHIRLKNLINEAVFVELGLIFLSVCIDIYWTVVVVIHNTKLEISLESSQTGEAF